MVDTHAQYPDNHFFEQTIPTTHQTELGHKKAYLMDFPKEAVGNDKHLVTNKFSLHN